MDTIIEKLDIFWEIYRDYIGLIGVSFIVSFVLTPLTGVLAQTFQAIDKPANLRDKTDETRERRIHNGLKPRLGGLAVVAAIVVGIFVARQNDLISLSDQKLIHIMLGILILTLVGFWDSVVDVSAKTQLLTQFIVAALVTLAGINISFIEILGTKIDFDVISTSVDVIGLTLHFSPIADIITILWIVGLINAINWVSGIDGLAAAMSIFAGFTLLFLGVKFEAVFAATLAAVLTGAVLGFFPFNFPPSNTFNGSIGDMVQGYLLAVLAVLSGAKLSTSIILLALPILDAIWVVIGRYYRHRHELTSPLDILKISDKTHLHHRLLALGLTIRQTLAIEITMFLGFCVAAYYLAGFRSEAVYMLIAVFLCLGIFTALRIMISRRPQSDDTDSPPDEPKRDIVIEEDTPEERYAY